VPLVLRQARWARGTSVPLMWMWIKCSACFGAEQIPPAIFRTANTLENRIHQTYILLYIGERALIVGKADPCAIWVESWCSNDFWHKSARTMLGNPRGSDSHINFWTVVFLLLFLLNSVTCNRFYFCFSASGVCIFLLFSYVFFLLFLGYFYTEISFS